MRRPRGPIALALALGAGLACAGSRWPAAAPIDWSREPRQSESRRAPFPVATEKGAVLLAPRAEYEIAAVVAAVERYRFDRLAFLSPLDVVLLWGALPSADFAAIEFTQSDRAYRWRATDRAIDPDYVRAHSANVHLIPAGDAVRAALLALAPGSRVRLRGLLVDAVGPRVEWRTSLSRLDDGEGGCELLWVAEVATEGRAEGGRVPSRRPG